MNPLIKIIDGITGEEEVRELTDQEYSDFLASGWTEEPTEEPIEEPTEEPIDPLP